MPFRIIEFLKYLNSLPFNLTVKHYYPFGEATASLKDEKLNSSESWDALRVSHPNFSIADERESWVRQCEMGVNKDGQDGSLNARAVAIVNLLKAYKFSSIHSVGVGGAALEYHIKRLYPNLRMTVSDYAPKNVEILKRVFHECDSVIEFDLLSKDWSAWGGDERLCIMMCRIDTELTDEQWRNVFKNMYESKIMNALYITSRILTFKYLYSEKKRYALHKLFQKDISFAGYRRTKSVFRSFWASKYQEHEFMFGGLSGFLLSRTG
jgi:hypothetical protein